MEKRIDTFWQAVPAPAPLTFRAMTEADGAFARELYVEHRLVELAGVPWPVEAKRAFLDSQYALQQRHYAAHYPGAASLLVGIGGADVGRLTLDAPTSSLHLVDVVIAASARGRGIGSALLDWIQRLARQTGVREATLHVVSDNLAARRLYERFGFSANGALGAHVAMTWPVPDVRQSVEHGLVEETVAVAGDRHQEDAEIA